jgi:hypothetical protein
VGSVKYLGEYVKNNGKESDSNGNHARLHRVQRA